MELRGVHMTVCIFIYVHVVLLRVRTQFYYVCELCDTYVLFARIIAYTEQ